MKYIFVFATLIFINWGCNEFIGSSDENSNIIRDAKGKIVSGTVKQYKNKVLHSVRNISNYKLHGKSTIYQEDGKTLKTEINYKEGIRHGEVKSYYNNGKLKKSFNYKDGQLDGEQKKYRKNGKLSSISFYKDGQPSNYLKEYLVNGELKKKYPKIIVEDIDKTLLTGEYKLRVKMSNNTRRVAFYLGKLTKDGFIPLDNVRRMNSKGIGYFEINYYLAPGQFIVEKVNIIAKTKTKLGNYYITTKTHNVAIENRLQ